jgi:penicillin-binding protein 1A
MSDWIFRRGGSNRLFSWMDLDSWIDSSINQGWQTFKNRWVAASDYVYARCRLTGKKRAANELVSEMVNVGMGGLFAMLVLAMPALKAVEESNWMATGQYSVTFLDKNGNEIGKRGILHNDAVPLEEIPDFLIKATLATEDRRFYEHFGIDFFGTLRAFFENVRAGETVQGGSTITQQLAKNLFLTSERSFQRKLKEAFLALWLETRLTKREILKLYLDRAYMGGGTFGVEAASLFYFGKSVRDLTIAEAAMLAGLFKAPTKFAPHINLPNARARADVVLTNMIEAGYMTEAQVHGARINPARPLENRRPDSPDYFLDWAFEEVQKEFAGRNEYVLTVKTTIDLSLQKAAEEAVQSTLLQNGRSMGVKNAAMVVMEHDGAVRALVGGQDYGESQFNRATHARRQPGSSFKTYVYITALEAGYTPKSTVRDQPVSCGNWSPKNYSGGYRGSMSMTQALAQSINTIAVDLSLKVGREKVLATVAKVGIHGVQKTCSMALGDTGITVLEHTQGYAVFAAGGKQVKAHAFTEAKNSKGEIIYLRERDVAPPEQIFEPRHVEMLNFMLGEVVTAGTGKRAQLEFTTSAGKTGTSTNYRDAWFLGFTGKYVAGVWMGNDDNRPMRNVTGGLLPAQAWGQFMKVAHTTPDIAPILGLPVHPNQAQWMRELIDQRRAEQTEVATLTNPQDPSNPQAPQTKRVLNLMPKEAREALKKISAAFRQAAKLEPKAPAPPPDKRAEAPAPPAALR